MPLHPGEAQVLTIRVTEQAQSKADGKKPTKQAEEVVALTGAMDAERAAPVAVGGPDDAPPDTLPDGA